MTLRETLCLFRAGRPVRSFPLGDSALEIGSHPSCDITIPEGKVAPRALLVHRCGGSVYVYDLAAGPGLERCAVMPLGRRFPIGARYCVTREKAHERPNKSGGSPTTELLRACVAEREQLTLVAGAGAEARAFHVGHAPMSIGSAIDNTIALSDRAVSQYHCRVEPGEHASALRDLASTNGTWVDGMRVQRQELRPGAILRIGRTELRVVRRGLDGLRPD
ncbi:MAG: FHA domain-containing protein, partial [Polyangiales bacterium]